MARNCSFPRAMPILGEKLHKTYMLTARCQNEYWLKVESTMGRHTALEAGEALNHLIIKNCMAGILQQAKTAMFAATIPNVTFSVPDKLSNHWLTCKKCRHYTNVFLGHL